MKTLWCDYNAVLVAMVAGGWWLLLRRPADKCNCVEQGEGDIGRALFVNMPIWPRSRPPPRLRLRPRNGQGQGKQQHQEKDQDNHAILTKIKATQSIPITVLNMRVNMCFLEKFTPPANILHCRR